MNCRYNESICKWFSSEADVKNCPERQFHHFTTMHYPCRAKALHKLHRLFPHSKPRYTLFQRIRRASVVMNLFPFHIGRKFLNSLPRAAMKELVLDVSFWLRETLFTHYWEEDRYLTWEEFLSHTKGREDIEEIATVVLLVFPLICRTDLDVVEQSLLSGPPSYDYASRADLIPETRTPPLIVPEKVLKEAVERVFYKTELALYLKKTKPFQRITFEEFCIRLDADPILSEMIVQQTRWMFSANLGKLKAIWECETLIKLPPLRIP